MSNDKALVRRHIERIPGVSRTWFEWPWDHEHKLFTKTLMVEVDFDTDPNSKGFAQSVLDAISKTARDVFQNETTMSVSDLRIVPRMKD